MAGRFLLSYPHPPLLKTSHQDISGKQDVIEDLADIRANAELAKTALQEVPAEYVTEEELTAKGYLTSVNMDGKQDVISDLETIRSGAAAGATALQAQVLDNYYTIEQIDNLIGVAIEKTNTILNA